MVYIQKDGGTLLIVSWKREKQQNKCSNKLRFYLFADDTNILYADKNVKALEDEYNK